jgi:ribosomal protein S18 acetylase RimI-like enzyme
LARQAAAARRHAVTILTPMRAEQFESFAEETVASYANDNVQAGRWSIQTARARSQNEFDRLLSRGLETPNHYIYQIEDEAAGQAVGFVWFAIVETGDTRHGYVYNIRVKPELRGRGHARAALELIEAVAAAHGLSTMALHVFSFNTGAQALYRSSGYGITGMNMLKPLRPPGGAGH